MILKIIFGVIAGAVGLWIAASLYNLLIAGVIAVMFGVLAFGVMWVLEYATRDFSPRSAAGAAAGLFVASVAFLALSEVLKMLSIPSFLTPYFSTLIFLLLAFIGISLGTKKGRESEPTGRRYSRGGTPKVLDTSVIIDGRIADVAEAGFIDGVMIIPKFVIKELQYIADSGEPVKRVRGRRGLDVLKRMQQEIPDVVVKVTGHDFPEIREVDLKLVELAKTLKGAIITNDFNLNKVAGLQGVKVLNLNELSNSLKPVVLPGETMNIHVIKEGKEENQGVGYLEDGTMVVVDDAKRYLGREIEVTVTSILQTPTGRMIFSKVREEDDFVSGVGS